MCLMLAAAMLGGCAAGDPGKTGASENGNGTLNSSVRPQRPEGSNYVIVQTPYGELYYQDQWEEFMRIEQTQEGNVLQVAFEAEINGKRYALFTLSIGGGNGSMIGRVMDSSGVKRDVYAVVHSVAGSTELNENEINRLYAMQEEINYVMQYLQ